MDEVEVPNIESTNVNVTGTATAPVDDTTNLTIGTLNATTLNTTVLNWTTLNPPISSLVNYTPSQTVFTTSGVFTFPVATIVMYCIVCVGGGGGASGSGAFDSTLTYFVGGNGGQPGGVKVLWGYGQPPDLGPHVVTIGAAGLGGTGGVMSGAQPTVGGNGGATTFGSLCSTPGGFGGTAPTNGQVTTGTYPFGRAASVAVGTGGIAPTAGGNGPVYYSGGFTVPTDGVAIMDNSSRGYQLVAGGATVNFSPLTPAQNGNTYVVPQFVGMPGLVGYPVGTGGGAGFLPPVANAANGGFAGGAGSGAGYDSARNGLPGGNGAAGYAAVTIFTH
jgi:hypothetical protein